MDCTDVRDALPLYLYGDLPAHEREAMARHLAGCDACRAELARIQETDRLLRDYLAAAPVLDRRTALRSRANVRMGTLRRHAAWLGIVLVLLAALSALFVWPTLAQTLLGYFRPREVDVVEAPSIPSIVPPSATVWMELAQIAEQAGFMPSRPQYLPAACALRDQHYDPADRAVKLFYACGLFIDQRSAEATDFNIGPGSGEVIDLQDTQALYVGGDWVEDTETGTLVWAAGPQQLWFERRGVLVHMAVTRPDALAREVFIRIAESME